ncbi:protein of unassigned function [Methylobacterium oryzae CBMB20]|uniref:Protein of unassigned function n=1 Tax=Methylobacterium oryzae CBMB20 TaxID=693986 RepID=A0A089NZA0_9HYPH|nr:protein of unassigned function [Methylobacterium oryzae CBMB20]
MRSAQFERSSKLFQVAMLLSPTRVGVIPTRCADDHPLTIARKRHPSGKSCGR